MRELGLQIFVDRRNPPAGGSITPMEAQQEEREGHRTNPRQSQLHNPGGRKDPRRLRIGPRLSLARTKRNEPSLGKWIFFGN